MHGKEQSQIIRVSISRKENMTSTQPEGSAILDAEDHLMFGLSSTPSTSAADTGGSNTISVAVTEKEEEPNAPPPPLGDKRELATFEEQGDRRTKNCAGAATAAEKKPRATSERDLPTGVYKQTSGKFVSWISWGGKTHYIGSFDTPEQASAAYVSVEKDRDDANLSAQSADEVNAAFDAAQKKALESFGGTIRKKELPTGVQKISSGKFKSMIGWGGKNRNIGSFDTPEQASAAFMSVRKDRDDANLSAQNADEVNATFDAAKRRALEAVGGNIRKKELPKGVQKTSSGKFGSRISWGGKNRNIGTFGTPEEASAAYLSVKTDLAYAKLSAVGADEVNATLFDAAQKKALESFGGVVAKKRDLPKGVRKTSSGKFVSLIRWGGKQRYIGSFDTPEQASAAFMSVRKDLAHAKVSTLSADEVDVLFYAAKKRALEAVGGTIRKKELPQGVKKIPSGKFQSQIYCNGTQRQIGLFDTPEEASAAYLSVKTDLAYANLSAQSADEVNDAFYAAKKKAAEAAGGFIRRKKKAKATKLPCPDDGERETKRKRKVAELGLATGTGVSEKQRGLQRAAVGHGEKIGKNGADHQATSERDLGGIFDPEVDGVLV